MVLADELARNKWCPEGPRSIREGLGRLLEGWGLVKVRGEVVVGGRDAEVADSWNSDDGGSEVSVPAHNKLVTYIILNASLAN